MGLVFFVLEKEAPKTGMLGLGVLPQGADAV